ncbi:MAG: right-handed parallel beta-helix repeat-containing protein [Planctomycetales bacterium]|nr:right-handed parallel beta-helix repeat-containing protein [Planctomycetales bacterium]
MTRAELRHRIQTCSRSGARSRLRRLLFESLEDRRVLATFVVNSLLDSSDGDSDDGVCDTGNASSGFTGICTFRAATITANNVPGLDRVHFDIPVEGIPTINLSSGASQYRTLRDPIIIDGTTQPAGMVELNGAGVAGDGLVFRFDASGSQVRGLVLNRFGESAIGISADNVTVVGNYFGTDQTGRLSDPDGVPDSGDEFGNGGSGVSIGQENLGNDFVGGRLNIIGGLSPEERNVFAGNATGVSLFTSDSAGNRVLGNYFGVDITGTVALSPGRGAAISLGRSVAGEGGGNLIGGTEPGAGNLIAGGFSGINIFSNNNIVQGNLIGVDITGRAALANASSAINVFGDNNLIGGVDPAARNVISASEIGVEIQSQASGNTVEGNRIGTDIDGVLSLGNGFGVVISDSPDNIIGGSVGNVISGSSFDGVLIVDTVQVAGNATNNLVLGNRIGTDVSGNIALPNTRNGVTISASSNRVGAALPGTSEIIGNLVSGNGQFGVVIGLSTAVDNIVQGNLIGTNTAGTAALGNQYDGVWLASGATNNRVGGTSAAARNLISGNAGDGVLITGMAGSPAERNEIIGNYIGTDLGGTLALANGFRGIHIDQHATANVVGGSGNRQNVISGNGSDGIVIALPTATENRVAGNLIGTDKDGTTALPNQGSGIWIFDAVGNLVGETDGSSFLRNVISGNQAHGVFIQGEAARENVVAGNLIGADFSGTVELPNTEHGVYILDASANRVGDVFGGSSSDPGFPGNVIAAKEVGVRIEGRTATQNEVLSNLIGVDVTGARPWTTIATAGVQVIDAPNNRIGVTATGTGQGGNTISNNRWGIQLLSLLPETGTGSIGTIVGGNFIGTDSNGQISDPPSKLGNELEGVDIEGFANNYIGGQPAGSEMLPGNTIAGNGAAGVSVIGARAVGNTIQGNSIHSNAELGIDLAGNGVSGLDTGDADAGPNELQNAAFVVPAVRGDGSYELVGTLHSTPSSTFKVEFFLSDVADPSGYGEGQTLIGFLDGVTTDNVGNALFSFTPPERPTSGFISATITNSAGSTSEFSCATPVQGIETDGHIFGVTTTDDHSPGSLRHAIDLANAHNNATENANATQDRIAFCLAGEGPHTFRPDSQLPTITDPVFIDGLTFTTATLNTLELDQGSNASFAIELDGSLAGPDAHGLYITSGGSVVQGLVINRFQGSAIVLEDNGGNSIDGNFIGTDVMGQTALANQGAGLQIKDSPGNFVGGLLPEWRNLISGNTGIGIEITGNGSTNNWIDGNLIGTNATGTQSLPNATGILIADASDNRIGGGGNIISGNTGNGIRIDNTDAVGTAEHNLIYGNRIGTNAMGVAALHNLNGVRISSANNNVVGGLIDNISVVGNLISGNLESGIDITSSSGTLIKANLVGTDLTGMAKIGNGQDGVTLGSSAVNNTIGGPSAMEGNVISGNMRDGIRIRGSSSGVPANENQVLGNKIGVNVTGMGVLGNASHGVRLGPNALKNVIGGSVAMRGNLISGNDGNGVMIEGTPVNFGMNTSENRIEGNTIGLFANGDLGAPNQVGVFIKSASGNTIGTEVANAGNVISGNNAEGLRIEGTLGSDATDNKILGNRIGTSADGQSDRGNKLHGVLILAADKNQLGGEGGTTTDACTGMCNVVAFNGMAHAAGPQRGHGVVVQADAQNLHATGNRIQRNSIFSNYGRGIDLGNDSFTLNDVSAADGDPDSGANGLQDYPVVTRVVFSGTDPNDDDPANPLPALGMNKRIYWTLNSTPNRTFAIDFFSNDDPDPNGFGEGKQYVATYTIKTDAKGNLSEAEDSTGISRLSTDNRSFFIDLPTSRRFVSATATDTTTGNTSEFSMVDTDGDAIADAWETQNIDHDGDGEIEEWEKGTIDVDENGSADHVTALFLPGASPNHKDLFVEVDLMVAPGLSQPDQATLDEVNTGRMGQAEGFSNVPNALAQNPDGQAGIVLHALISDTNLDDTEYLDSNPADADDFPDGWNEFDALKARFFGNPAIPASPGQAAIPSERGGPNSANILAAKRLVYRYTIFGNERDNNNTTSGLAELPNVDNANDEGPFGANDFQVTLGGWNTSGGTQDQQKGTFMHELGHTLGLGHGGAPEDGTNYKPNYYSVMNYLWQNPSPTRNGWRIDYSSVNFGNLDEANLDEAAGVITTTIAADRSTAVSLANGAQLYMEGPWVRPFFEDRPPIDDLGSHRSWTRFRDLLLRISRMPVGTVIAPSISVNPIMYGANLPPLTAADRNNALLAYRRLTQAISSGGAMPMANPFDWSRIPAFDANGVSIADILPNLAALAQVAHDGDGRVPGSGVPPAPADNEEPVMGSRDLNENNSIQVLRGREDWSKLRFYFLESIDGAADGVHTPHEVDEKQFDPQDEIFMDFGDAPNDGQGLRYPTLEEDDGARHVHIGLFNPLLGTRADMEGDGMPEANALGDDEADGVNITGIAAADDEDGVQFDSPLVPGSMATITVTVQLPAGILDSARLDAWIDFNSDGDWEDAGEKVFNSIVVTQGENLLQFPVPSESATGRTFARFRLSSAGGLEATGLADDGEVEDYAVTLGSLATDIRVQAFGTNASEPLSSVVIDYSIVGSPAPPFNFAFYASNVPQLVASATRLVPTITVSDSNDLAAGIHRLVIDGGELAAALGDVNHEYILIVADDGQLLDETDETNNLQSFVGVFHASNSPSPIVIRGHADASSMSAQDQVEVAPSSSMWTVGFNGTQHQISQVDVTELIVLGLDGDDQLILGGVIPVTFYGGPGDDLLRISTASLFDPASEADLHSVETIDMLGGGANAVLIRPEDVRRLSGDTHTLLLRHDENDELQLDPQWVIAEPIFEGGQAYHVMRSTDAELRVANTRAWQNPLQRLDTNRDGFISPSDLLAIINTLNGEGARQLPIPNSDGELPRFYFDTNGDQFVSPIDVLLGVNFLNAQSGLSGEGEVQLDYSVTDYAIDFSDDSAAPPIPTFANSWIVRREFASRSIETFAQMRDQVFADWKEDVTRRDASRFRAKPRRIEHHSQKSEIAAGLLDSLLDASIDERDEGIVDALGR